MPHWLSTTTRNPWLWHPRQGKNPSCLGQIMCSNWSKAKNLPKGGKGERIGWRGAIAEDYLQDPAVCRAWKLKANKNISAEYLLKYRRILSRILYMISYIITAEYLIEYCTTWERQSRVQSTSCFSFLALVTLLSPSGDLGIGLVRDNPTGPTFWSDCLNPLQTELDYLWGVLSCFQDDIRWF